GRFNILACVDKERSFCDTIRANKEAGKLHTHLAIFEEDITNLDPKKVLAAAGLKPGELDLLVGGPPCQAFSTAGKRGTIQDPRGTLPWDFLRFIECMKPRMFLMENVRGLLSAALRHRPIATRPERGGSPLETEEEPGSVVRLFAEDLTCVEGCGYHMDCFEVNAVNYGAPQLRERALFIGNRLGIQFDFPNPTHGSPCAPNNGRSSSEFVKEDGRVKPWRTLRDAIGHLDNPGDVIMDFSPRKKSYLAMVPEGSNWRSLPLEIQKESMGRAWFAKGGRSGWWRRLTFDLPCPTLVTMPNHAGTSLCHPTEVRALSLKEYALIQEFPIDWAFCGTAAQQYAQVGNAVPVRLGIVSGNAIAEFLDRIDGNDDHLVDAPKNHRIIYLQSHIRTRQWFKSGKTFVWKDGEDNSKNTYESPQTLRRTRVIG
ncbi:MAG: DNA cytosine methyltransferase, partial [Magnetococcales bacterium]|nr:DNA cytosine methyltransferase [Magnetococcales bacterium]